MDLHAIRRKRLKQLIDQQFDGIKAQFARHMEWKITDVQRYFTPGKHGRNITERSARANERRFPSLGAYWMDTDGDPALGLQQPVAIYHLPPKTQAKLLELFDGLTDVQQDAVLEQIETFHRMNQAVLKQLGGRAPPAPSVVPVSTSSTPRPPLKIKS